jgi:hypothetical protein
MARQLQVAQVDTRESPMLSVVPSRHACVQRKRNAFGIVVLVASLTGLQAQAQQIPTGSLTNDTLFANFTPLEKRAAVISQATFNVLDPLCAGGQPAAACTSQVFDVYANVRELVATAEELLAGRDSLYGLNLDAEGLGFALRWTSAEELLAQGSSAEDFASSQSSTLGNRIGAIRAASRANLYARNRVSELIKYGYAATAGVPASSAGDDFSRLSAFFDVSNGFGKKADTTGLGGVSTNGNEDAFDFEGYEYTLGLDWRFSDSLVAGGLLGYTDRYVDFDSTRSIVDGYIQSDGLSLLAFLQWDQLHYYASASVGYQKLAFDTYRVISYPSLDPSIDSTNTATAGDPDSQAILATANFGVPFQWGPVGADLYLAADFQQLKIDAFAEEEVALDGGNGTGFQFNVAGQTIKSLDAAVGGKLAYTWTPRFGIVVPYLRAEYHRQMLTARSKLFLNFANLPDDVASEISDVVGPALLSDKPDDGYATVSLGFSAVIRGSSRVNANGRGAGGLQGYLQFTTVEGLRNYNSKLITGGLRYEF